MPIQKNNDDTYQFADRGYKRLLAFKQIFGQLMQDGYIDSDWTSRLDIANSEAQDKSFILPGFEKMESDMLYKVPLKSAKKQEIYLYVLIESQSKVDYSLAFRILLYLVEIWRDIYNNTDEQKRQNKSFRLPPVFPIVLYNGKRKWTAVTSVKEMVEESEIFGDFLPNVKYHLVDIPRLDPKKLNELGNSLSGVFLLDREIAQEEFESVLNQALENIFKDKNLELKRAIIDWIMNRFKEKAEEFGLTQVIEEIVLKSENQKEMKSMLEMMPKKLVDWGKAEGKIEGKAEGKAEGVRESLIKVLKSRYKKIPNVIQKKIDAITEEKILLELLDEALKTELLSDFKKTLNIIK